MLLFSSTGPTMKPWCQPVPENTTLESANHHPPVITDTGASSSQLTGPFTRDKPTVRADLRNPPVELCSGQPVLLFLWLCLLFNTQVFAPAALRSTLLTEDLCYQQTRACWWRQVWKQQKANQDRRGEGDLANSCFSFLEVKKNLCFY